jgi:hypothetical protein
MPHAAKDDTVYRIGRDGRLLWEWSHRELVAKLDPVDPAYRKLIDFLFTELQEQALFADLAIELAKAELGINSKRIRGGRAAGRDRRKVAEQQDSAMKAQARRLLKINPHLTIPEQARRISDRPDDGVARAASTIEKKLRRAAPSRKVDAK